MAVYQSLSVRQISQSIENNSTQVRILWQSTQTGGTYNLVQREAKYYISCNGAPETEHTVTYQLPANTEQTVADVTVTLPHNEKGEASITVRTWMDTHVSAGVIRLEQTLVADTIPRVTTLMATDGVIGGVSRLALTKRNPRYSHSVAWQCQGLTGYLSEAGKTSQEEVIFSGDSLDFSIPELFYMVMPNQKQASCSLTVSTYDGQTLVGTPQTTEILIRVSAVRGKPKVSGSVTDICEETLALTGDPSVLISHHSTAQCAISATAFLGASITQKQIQGREVTDRLTIEEYTGQSVTFQATDSRGFTTTVTEAVTVIPYVKLTCEPAVKRVEPAGSSVALNLTGTCYLGTFGAADNQLTLSYRVNGGEPVTVVPKQTEDHRYSLPVLLTGLDYTRVHTITVTAADCLETVEKTLILKKSIPVFDWGEQDFAFHVPVTMDTPLGVESGGTGGAEPEQAWEGLGLTIPMEPGREYVTWRRFQGKPVYTMLMEGILMPANSCTAIQHWLPATAILSCRGCMSDGRMLPWGGAHSDRVALYGDTEKIYVDSAGDYSGLTATVMIEYIKD